MAGPRAAIEQAAVIAVRAERVCLVTSRSGKRWVVPKGCLEPGKTAGEVALQEAWEEAGLLGLLAPEPIGSYVYEKWCGVCHVTVFPLDVASLAQEWPERGVRQRIFLTPTSALKRIDDPGLYHVLEQTFLRAGFELAAV